MKRYKVLASDYDETLARHGQMSDTTILALERLRSSGRNIVLVTGRELDDLKSVCPRLDLFDFVVAENGALLHRPSTGEVYPLADPPPLLLAEHLQRRGVNPLSCGRVIIATLRPHEIEAQQLIHHFNLPLQIILNKESVMILPHGVDKASGLKHALARLEISANEAITIGDAENDLPLLQAAGFSAAVANALPSVKNAARFVSRYEAGAGVEELIKKILKNTPFPPSLT